MVDQVLENALTYCDGPPSVRIRAWRDYEIKFDIAFIAVEFDIDAGVDAAIAYAAVMRDVGAPVFRITAEEIIYLPGHLSERVAPCFGIGSEQFDMERDCARRVGRKGESAWLGLDHIRRATKR